MIRLTYIIVLSLILERGTMFSQCVEWSFFPSSFCLSQSASTTLMSSVGEPFVGFSQIGCTSIRSGPLFTNVVIESNNQLPLVYTLYQNYPNPFNLSTTVRYDLPKATFVNLNIFDVLGRQVSTIVEGEKPAGTYEVIVYVPNLASGIYFYRILARDYMKTKKFVLLK